MIAGLSTGGIGASADELRLSRSAARDLGRLPASRTVSASSPMRAGGRAAEALRMLPLALIASVARADAALAP